LPLAKAPSADADADGDEDAKNDDEEAKNDDDETPAAANPPRGAGLNPRGPRVAPGRHIPDTTELQLDEGAELPTKLDDQPSAEKIAESAMNLQELEGLASSEPKIGSADVVSSTKATPEQQPGSAVASEVVAEQKTGQSIAQIDNSAAVDAATLVAVKAVSTGPITHRHSWRTGVNVPQQLVQEHTEVNTHGVETAKPRNNEVAGDVEYLFHGHKFSATGQQLDAAKTVTVRSIVEDVATQILTQLEEGRNVPSPNVVETDQAENATVIPSVDNTIPLVAINTTKTTNTSQEVVEIAPAPTTQDVDAPANSTATVTVSALNATLAPNATSGRGSENSDEDSDREDAVQALQHLARSHPHASSILSRALEMAAMQQRVGCLFFH